jgi:acyl-CoA reductase-like NAD-dependent aldehyde dehydrogenase
MTDELARFGVVGVAGATTPATGDYFPVGNPTTGQTWAQALEAGPDVVDDVVRSAEQTYLKTWRHTGPEARGQLLRSLADTMLAHKDELTDLEVTDVGHLRREAQTDVERGAEWLNYFAGLSDKIEGRTLAGKPGRLAYEVREPYGVVGGVNPFNGNPLMLAMKLGPALAAGNCLVLKAPELAPASSFRIAELALQAGLPPGVFSVITGRGEVTGKLLNEHPAVGMLAFTGSVRSARAVIEQSARTIMPLTLELGGKSAVIVLDDADLNVAIPSILHSNFVKSGQSCVAGSRVFVSADSYEKVCARFAQTAGRVRVGDPRDPDSDMGPLITRRQRDWVEGLVAKSVAAGARCLAGGRAATDGLLGAGSFFQPTVLADVTDDNIVAREEVFGPVMSILKYTDVDEVLRRANATTTGLSAQVWGNDASTIQHLTQNLECGMVWVNTYRAIDPSIPFGGMKESGYGRENSFNAVELYTRPKAIVWELDPRRSLPYANR